MDPHDQQGEMEGEELERQSEGVRMGKRVTHRQAGDRVSVCGRAGKGGDRDRIDLRGYRVMHLILSNHLLIPHVE